MHNKSSLPPKLKRTKNILRFYFWPKVAKSFKLRFVFCCRLQTIAIGLDTKPDKIAGQWKLENIISIESTVTTFVCALYHFICLIIIMNVLFLKGFTQFRAIHWRWKLKFLAEYFQAYLPTYLPSVTYVRTLDRHEKNNFIAMEWKFLYFGNRTKNFVQANFCLNI